MASERFSQIHPRRLALIVVEHAVVVLALAAATAIRLGVETVVEEPSVLLARAMVVAVVLQICLHYCDLYDPRTLGDRRDLITGLISALGAACVVLALLYYWFPILILGRGVFMLGSVLIIALVAGWRIAFEWLSLSVGSERLLIVGTNTAAVALARELFERRGELGINLVGFVDPDPERVGMPLINPGVIGTVDSIPEIVQSRGVDRVVVSLGDARGKLNMEKLLDMKINRGVRFDHLASVYEQYTGKIAVENLRPSWLIFSEGFRKSRLMSFSKRLSDVLIALVGLLIMSPVMLLVTIAVRLGSAGPVF